MPISDFDEYCRAFSEEGELYERAKLLHYLRGWFINVQDLDSGRDEEKLGYVSLTELVGMKERVTDDEISRIAKGTMEAVRHIANNFRDCIVRENVMMPIYRAKELDSAGLSWLSKRSGRTVREKLASTNKLLAVRRRLSLNTGENQLFVAFVRELEEHIDQKGITENFSLTVDEKNFQEYALKLLHSDEIEEIGRWENLPPNNTLLSDRFYRQVWRGWTDLQNVSVLIKSDNDHLGQRLSVVYFWKLVAQAAKYCRFTQQPIEYNYQEFEIKPLLGQTLRGWYNKGTFSATLGDSEVRINHNNAYYCVKFLDMTAALYRGDEELNRALITVDNLDELIKQATFFIFGNAPNIVVKNAIEIESLNGDLYIDVFATKPAYLDKNNEIARFNERIIRQRFMDKDKIYDVSLEQAVAIYTSTNAPSYSLASCMHQRGDVGNKVDNLIQMIAAHFISANVQNVCVPLPDIYNEFQLSTVRRALRVYYNQIYTMPRSIACLFNEISHERIDKYKDGDFALMVDYVNGKISMTLLEAKFNEIVECILPETRGFVWERHPTYSQICVDENNLSYTEFLNDILLKLGLNSSSENISHILSVFGVKGLPLETELVFEFDDNGVSLLSHNAIQSFSKSKFQGGNILTDYLERIKSIVSSHKIYTYILSNYVNILDRHTNCAKSKMPLRGIKYYRQLLDKIAVLPETVRESIPPLWSDELPALAIKRLYGEFELIDANSENKISPQFGLKQFVPIKRHFVLPQGQIEYRFGLIMGKSDRDIDYEAVVRHRAFPLSRDTECELELTYTYGKDIPYELLFKPVDKDAAFHQAEVLWEEAKEQPFMGLQYPPFKPDGQTWQTLRHVYTLKKEDSDALEWIEGTFSGRTAIDFDDEKTVYYHDNYDVMILANINGGEAIVKLTGKSSNLKDVTGNIHGAVNFTPVPDKHANELYRIHVDSFDSINLRRDKNGNPYCFIWVNDEHPSVAFFDSAFIFGANIFDMHDCDVIFKIYTNKHTGKESAQRIIIDRVGYDFYFAARISYGRIPYDIEKLRVLYPLHKVYFNGRSINTPDCPESFRHCVEKIAKDMPQYFLSAWKEHDDDLAWKLFRIMCIMSADIGHTLYEIADVVIRKRPKLIDDDLGCAFGDYDTEDRQRLMLTFLTAENISLSNKIAVLAKAAWKSDGFMRNAPPHILLDYFDKALAIVADYKKGNKKTILQALEYILAVFRLRERGDADLNRKLSLNNAAIRNLYATVEEMIEDKYELPQSRLDLQAKQSAEFSADGISDFYYSLLVYITGGEDEIILVGVNETED